MKSALTTELEFTLGSDGTTYKDPDCHLIKPFKLLKPQIQRKRHNNPISKSTHKPDIVQAESVQCS